MGKPVEPDEWAIVAGLLVSSSESNALSKDGFGSLGWSYTLRVRIGKVCKGIRDNVSSTVLEICGELW